MAKPTNLFRWATNAGRTLEPSSGDKDVGFQSLQKPPPRWLNWLWNGAYLWHQYLDNLHNEADFLDKDYTWTGAQRFLAGLACAGINLDHASNEYAYLAPRARTTYVNLLDAAPLSADGVAAFSPSNLDSEIVANRASLTAVIPIKLVTGATLTRIRAGANQGSSAATNMRLYAYAQGVNLTTPSAGHGTATAMGAVAGTGGAGDHVMDTGTFSETIAANKTYFVSIDSSSSCAGLSPDSIYWLELSWLDPGPRNR